MQRPDFNTINLFRKNRLADVMDDIFTQVVQMLVDAKFVSLEVHYIDGTKIESNATKTNQDKLDLKVKSILREAERELNMELKDESDNIMTAEEMHRSRRPIEPEAVFGQIKYDNHFKRFSYRGKRLVTAELAAIAVAHNIRKMISKGYYVCLKWR